MNEKEKIDKIKDILGDEDKVTVELIVYILEDSYCDLITEHKIYRNFLGTSYTYRIDVPKGELRSGNLKHIHVFAKKGHQIFAMNIDGTAHDGYHQIQIPKSIADQIEELGFTLPPDNLIESVTIEDGRSLLFY